jgi:hypothetical protein
VECNELHEKWLKQVKIIMPLYSKTNKRRDPYYTIDMVQYYETEGTRLMVAVPITANKNILMKKREQL